MADIAAPPQAPPAAAMRLSTAQPAANAAEEAIRNHHLGMDVFSPVNQNGSFEFDRVLKSGEAQKRTRKTKTWKTIYLVLRPHTLSIYKDREETKLRHQIILTDLTAVARQRDPKKKAKNVFGLFSPSRNYHIAALSDKDAQDWIELIRREARIDEEEEEMILASPNGGKNVTFHGFERRNLGGAAAARPMRSEILSSDTSDGEALARPPSSMKRDEIRSARRPSHTLAYSGNEQASFSDFSDNPASSNFQDSALSFSQPNEGYVSSDRPAGLGRNTSQASNVGGNAGTVGTVGTTGTTGTAGTTGTTGTAGTIGTTGTASSKPRDEERVVCQGWLYILKSKGGVRQWKKLWGVLRPKSMGLYKNEDEYSATLIIPFPNILDAVDIDPISKSKRYCIQVISEERNYRFCAPDEDQSTQWLGALKMLLAKRKEAEVQQRAAAEKAERERAAAGLGVMNTVGTVTTGSGRPEAASPMSGGSGGSGSGGSHRGSLPVR
ncbi:uncharacterized protein K452DRAFT_311154 [Aplosporella prunicola CBS 121167]|uniref:PH domain-containing protein n=1 Tax=Aplosporella prunicola CBS 121167 TaxID=1176127 RepID=A0A6A6B4A4_9PEZI|nr:uncharacterized protein K452DRAFT_311154 [Aplosporella prunicola CBS 121167]KAF2138666.1 hypothetical protein K452DRAFT_311154 [Aplosporella prunicola CBS 121167]